MSSGDGGGGGGDSSFGYLNFNRVRYAKPMRYESLEVDDDDVGEADEIAGCVLVRQ